MAHKYGMVFIEKKKHTNKEDLKDWCWLNVGHMHIMWYYRNDFNGYRFTFLNEDDATAFKLKFG